MAISIVGIGDANDSGMNRNPGVARKKGELAFGIVEVLAMLTVVLVLGWLLMPRTKGCGASATRIKCVNNLKNVGLAFRIFATDNGDMFPAEVMASNGVEVASTDIVSIYGSLSNELSTPKILLCPEDKKKEEATSFTNFSGKNISYFASLTAKETLPTAFLGGDRNLMTNGVPMRPGLLTLTTNLAIAWTKELHKEQGDVVMGDGSVQQMSSSRLKGAIRDQDIATNDLLIP